MTVKAATESTLGELHAKVAKVMHGALDSYDKAQTDYLENGDPEAIMPEPNASLISVITKFLSDNKISCVAEESQELSGLAQRLAGKKKRTVGNVVHLDKEAG